MKMLRLRNQACPMKLNAHLIRLRNRTSSRSRTRAAQYDSRANRLAPKSATSVPGPGRGSRVIPVTNTAPPAAITRYFAKELRRVLTLVKLLKTSAWLPVLQSVEH